MIWLQAGLVLTIIVLDSICSIFTEKIKSEKAYVRIQSILFIFAFIALTAIWSLRYGNIGLMLLDIGVFLNMVVIVSNKGYMPVDLGALKRFCPIEFGSSDEVVQKMFREVQQKKRQYIAMSDNTKFNILGDKYGYESESIGDIFIRIGILLIILELIFYLFLYLFQLI